MTKAPAKSHETASKPTKREKTITVSKIDGKTRKKAGKSTASEQQLKNLAKGKRFSSEYQPENYRQPAPAKLFKEMPADAKEKIVQVCWEVLKCNSKAEAQKIISNGTEGLGEFGLIYQRFLLEIIGKNGFHAAMEIIYWLFGFSKQQIETIDLTPPPPLSPRKQKGKKK